MAKWCLLVSGIDYPKFDLTAPHKLLHWKNGPVAGPWRGLCERMTLHIKRRDPTFGVLLWDRFRGTMEHQLPGAPAGRPWTVAENIKMPSAISTKDDYRLVSARVSTREQFNSAELIPISNTAPAPGMEVFHFPGVSEIGNGSVLGATYIKRFYPPRRPKNEGFGIDEVLRFIQGVAGSNSTDRFHEVHFFSHAFRDGPILSNTLDLTRKFLQPNTSRPTPPIRDHLDQDGRAYVDFQAGGIPGLNLATFRKAFSEDAYCQIWGCGSWPLAKRFVTLALQHADNHRVKWAGENDWLLLRDVPVSPPIFESSVAVMTRPLRREDYRAILRFFVDRSYPRRMALALGRTVVGALPGTYSDYDSHDAHPKLMHVPTGCPGDSHNFSRVLELYKELKLAKFEKAKGFPTSFGRGYGVFNP